MEHSQTKPKQEAGFFNPANAFTFARIPGAIFGLVLLSSESYQLAGVIIIALSALTDFFDGIIAREFDCVTEFGAMADTIADKTLMILVIIYALANYDQEILIVAVLAIELSSMGLAAYAKFKLNYPITVVWAGKKGMFMRMTFVCAMLMSEIGRLGSFATEIMYISWLAGSVLGFMSVCQYTLQCFNEPQPGKHDERGFWPHGHDSRTARFVRKF